MIARIICSFIALIAILNSRWDCAIYFTVVGMYCLLMERDMGNNGV